MWAADLPVWFARPHWWWESVNYAPEWAAPAPALCAWQAHLGTVNVDTPSGHGASEQLHDDPDDKWPLWTVRFFSAWKKKNNVSGNGEASAVECRVSFEADTWTLIMSASDPREPRLASVNALNRGSPFGCCGGTAGNPLIYGRVCSFFQLHFIIQNTISFFANRLFSLPGFS